MERHKGKDKKIHCVRQGNEGSTEDFIKRFLTESRKAKKVSDTVKIAKFIRKTTNPEMAKHIRSNAIKSMNELVRTT